MLFSLTDTQSLSDEALNTAKYIYIVLNLNFANKEDCIVFYVAFLQKLFSRPSVFYQYEGFSSNQFQQIAP